jgi:frataxin-like iron-binding protein CyaY
VRSFPIQIVNGAEDVADQIFQYGDHRIHASFLIPENDTQYVLTIKIDDHQAMVINPSKSLHQLSYGDAWVQCYFGAGRAAKKQDKSKVKCSVNGNSLPVQVTLGHEDQSRQWSSILGTKVYAGFHAAETGEDTQQALSLSIALNDHHDLLDRILNLAGFDDEMLKNKVKNKYL